MTKPSYSLAFNEPDKEHRTLKHIFLMNIRIKIHKVCHILVQTMDSYNEEIEGTTEIPCV